MPIAALVLAIVCFQVGAAFAKSLFPVVGATGTTALRLTIASAILLPLWRPWRLRPSPREARVIVLYGLALGFMNLFFYLALRSIPLGIAVALEFTGPLAVAMASSRRISDFLWVLLAVMGLLALLPLGFGNRQLQPLGIACALAAGACWALYIIFGRKAGAAHGGQTVALATLIGAIAVVPIGAVAAGSRLFSPGILPIAITVALLSSAIPYSLEIFALPRIPPHTFGILMSLDPAFATLAGLCFLGESLTAIQWAALICIMVASAGSAANAGARNAAPAIPHRLPD